MSLANYKCPCGRVFFVIRPGASLRYVVCNCVISDEYARTDKGYECPSTSCRTIQNYYNSLMGFKPDKLLWCYVNDAQVVSNWKRATESVALIQPFQKALNRHFQFRSVDDIRAPLFRIPLKDNWRLNICVLCGAPTHYARVKNGVTELCILGIFGNK